VIWVLSDILMLEWKKLLLFFLCLLAFVFY